MRVIEFLKSLWSTYISILALAGALLLVQLFIFRKPIDDWKRFSIGIIFAGLGLHFFIIGAEFSLIPLGESVGRNMSLLSRPWMILLIGFVVGYFGTLVEPALRTLALEVEEISIGAIPNNILVHAVAIGFGTGMAIGLFRILKNIPYLYIALPLILIIILLMLFASDQYRAIAMDAASATTGPVNIPLNMAIAIGLAGIIEGIDPLMAGFGIIGLTSLGAVVSVMILGIIAG